jgi:ornithine decarboxylase
MIFTKGIIESSKQFATPFILLDREHLRAKYRQVRQSFPGVGIFYAVKANPHQEVLQVLHEEGSGFEISSGGELCLLQEMGVPAERIICSNPVKPIQFIEMAYQHGIDRYACDSLEELHKLARHGPGSRVYIRLTVDNTGSEWPLSKKYGTDAAEALELLRQARSLGLEPYGLTFHVGSQCLNKSNWVSALFLASTLWESARGAGLPLKMLSLGGGLPIQHTKPIPSLAGIANDVQRTIKELFPPDVELTIEPGRAIVGDSGILVASVIGKARRGSESWLYLDAGVFNGLMETIEGFSYELRTERPGPMKVFTVAGPSCDSVDVMFKSIPLPDLQVGERIYILNAGAYTLSYASSFNGFPPPAVYYLDGADRLSPGR